MKKLHSFALHALVTPVIALGAGSVLAQQAGGQDSDREQQSTQRDQDATLPRTTQSDQSTQRDQSTQLARRSDSQTAAGRENTRDESRKQNRGFMDSAPANGMQASDLIGAEVRTTGDEDVGSLDDLIIDENGQVVAIVVGAGGFLGIAEKDVAIGWDDVTRSGASDEQEVQIHMTREDLRSAPEFEKRD